MKKRAKRVIILSLTGIFSFVFIVSCSTKVNFLRRGGFSEPNQTKSGYEGLTAQFASKVRPYRGNPDSHYLLACYYQERGEHESAIEEFEKVLLIAPDHFQALNGMGISHDHLKNYSRAIESYQRALRWSPEIGPILNNLGYSYLLQGRLDEAISSFQKAISLNGQDGRLHNNLGLAFAIKGQLHLAMVEFQLAGDEAKAHYNIARFYHKRGLYRIAQIHYSRALALDPSFRHARAAAEAVDALAKIFQPSGPTGVETRVDPGSPRTPSPPERQMSGAQPERASNESEQPGLVSPETNGTPLPVVETDWMDHGPYDPATRIAEPLSLPSLDSKAKAQTSHPAPQEKGKSSFPKKVGIEISNGNGVKGMARRVSQLLKDKGLPVKRVTNADNFNYRQTRIYYQDGYQEAALQVADRIPGFQTIEEQEKFDRPNISVKVIIGKDLQYDRLLKGGRKS